ncbi:MAG: putative Ig domain-containing protein [Candidatus Acidiferrales bacterium]
MTSPKVYARTGGKSAKAGGAHDQGFGGWMGVRESLLALLVICGGILLVSGCHSGSAGITVQILPNSTVSLDSGQSYNFTATVANDIHNQGVTWSLTQTTSCSGSGCGTLSKVTNSSVTYTAPSNLTAALSITLTAASVSQTSATTTATISIAIPVTFTTTTLPNGANGVPYNQSITVTGGVTPLTFSLQSGTLLPMGLTLNSTGSIVGKPTAPTVGQQMTTSSFTVVVTDNGTPPVAVTEPYTISVTPPPVLAITSTSVPAAVANTNYAAQVATTGGVSPLTWTLLTGTGAAPFNTLPHGLGLGTNSGQITGVVPQTYGGLPTAGTYNFKVQVQDSSLPSAQSLQQSLSIVVTTPQSLTISSTVLPTGTTATAYNASLQAAGGITPYTWTVTSGQLPSGLTLGPDGTISGVPVLATTSPDNFTVKVTDSEVMPQVVSQALSISIAAGSTSGDSLINGSYSFLFNGFDSNGSVAIAGSIATDGNGNITSGEEDSNRSGTNNLITAIPLVGSYSLGSDGRGTMELVAFNPSTHVSLTTDYRIVLDSSGTIHFIQNNDITTVGVGTDTLGTHGEGIMKPIVGSFSGVSFNGNYSFLFAGQDTSAKPAALAGAIRADGNGNINPAAGGVSSDFNDNGTISSQNISGTFSVGAMNNRGTAEFLFQIPGKSASTLQFAFYFVTPLDIYFVETDSSTTALSPVYYRLSGEMIAQNSSYAFSNSSLLGTSVVSGSGLNGSNASVLAGLLTSTVGAGGATLTYDENNGGAITSPSPSFSGTYSVAGNGRTPFTSLGSRAAVAYLTGPGQGFLLGSDAAVTTGLLEQQSGAPFATSSVQGGYTISTSLPVETNVPNLLGQVSSDGAGSVTGIVDEIDPPVTATPEGKANLNQSLIAHINFIGTNGRGTATTNSPTGIPATMIFYLVSPAHFRAISADSNPGNSHPDVLFFDH